MTCTKCNEQKGLVDFPANKQNKSGYSSWCRKCHYANSRKWVGENRDRQRELNRKHYVERHDRIRERAVNYRLQSRYGITEADYDEMFEKQGGVCAICKEPYEGSRLYVDHDHKTSEVRGLLCPNCNFQLGIIEKYEWVTAAFEYLVGE